MHAELEQRLRFCSNLPSLPAVALKMVELANNPDVHLNDLARVISMDPALVTKLFRAANSPLYGLNRKVTNLRQVLNLMGLQGTLALALGFSLIATGRDAGAVPLNTEQFWRRSLMTATACRILGERLSMKNLEELFLAGLLQGVGVLALSMIMPQPYGVLLQAATEHPEGMTAVLNYQRLAELERKQLGDDHAAVGAWLMQHWRLPDYLTVATAGSLDPDHSDTSDRYRALVQSVALATRIADIWTRPHDWQNSPEVAKLAQQWFGLETGHYMEILEQMGAKFPEIAALFQIKPLDANQIAGILDQAREALDIRAVQRWPERTSHNTLSVEPSRPVVALPNQLPLIPTLANSRSIRSQHDPATRPSTGQYAFDALTGLLNQPHLSDRLRQEMAAAKEQNWPLSVVLLDVDNLRQINESCGHGVGDQVLVALARLISGHIRHQELVARHQDDAFALLLPASGAKAARKLIEQLMGLIHGWEPVLEGGQRLRGTVSAGLATYPETCLAGCRSGEQLLEAASQALRLAQDAGGGQLSVYGTNRSG